MPPHTRRGGVNKLPLLLLCSYAADNALPLPLPLPLSPSPSLPLLSYAALPATLFSKRISISKQEAKTMS